MSSIVVFGFRTCSRCRWRVQHRTDHYTCHFAAIIAPIKFLVISLRSSWNDLPVGESLALIGAATCPHTPPEFSASTHHALHAPHALSKVQADVTRDVICSTSALAASAFVIWSAPRHLGDVICWPLTLTSCWLFQSSFFLPSFSRRFHFCSLFLHIVSLNG